MRKLWWLANIYWIILIMYGGGKLFTYGFDTSELGETASYALILLVLISASVLIIEFQAAWGISRQNPSRRRCGKRFTGSSSALALLTRNR